MNEIEDFVYDGMVCLWSERFLRTLKSLDIEIQL